MARVTGATRDEKDGNDTDTTSPTWLPDLLVCRVELAATVVAAVKEVEL